MALPPFRETLEKFLEPWKSIVRMVGERWDEERFLNNYVVWGEYPRDEQVVMNAWSMVGIAPECPDLLECHLTSGDQEHERSHWVSRLQAACSVLPLAPELSGKGFAFLYTITRLKLGEGTHIVGILSLHQLAGGTKECGVLWTNPELNPNAVKHIMKMTLDRQLKS